MVPETWDRNGDELCLAQSRGKKGDTKWFVAYVGSSDIMYDSIQYANYLEVPAVGVRSRT
jgi:hypothetical protein